jgi:hypothetical protein
VIEIDPDFYGAYWLLGAVLDVTGRVARVRESDHHGVVIDHFHPLKVGERWSIVSTLWDAEP